MDIFPSLCKRQILFTKKVFSVVIMLGLLVQPMAPSFFTNDFFISTAIAADESEAVETSDEEKSEDEAAGETEEVDIETESTDEESAPVEEEKTVTESTTEEVVAEVSETSEATNSEEEKTSDETPIEEAKVAMWQTEGDKATTTGSVELGVQYEAPQNKDVSVTFTKLPETAGTLTIEEITLTKEQIEATGSLSDKAYDITSSMENGSFEYELTLPIPEGKENVQILYADKIEDINEDQVIKADDVKTEEDSVTVELDHFTIFIATYSNVSLTTNATTFAPGDTVYINATGLTSHPSTYYRLYVVEPNATEYALGVCAKSITSLSGSHVLAANAPGVTWQTIVRQYNGNGNCTANTNIQASEIADFTVTGVATVVYVSSTYNSGGANDSHTWGYDAFDNLQDAINAVADGGTVIMESDITISAQVTIGKPLVLDGNGHTLSPTFSKTSNSNNTALGIIGTSNVTIENLEIDGVGGTNLHGINVYESTTVFINGTTLINNDRTGLVVNSSGVTINDITTANNGWHGINVDSTGLVTALTVNGVSSHTDLAHIYVDNTTEPVTVNDTNNQYTITNNVLKPNDRLYTLTLPDTTAPDMPVHVTPADNTSINYNDFYFQWTDVSDAVEYEFQSATSPAVDGNGVLTTGVWNNKVHGGPDRNYLTDSEIHSYGANGTWYWQVRARDAAGNWSAWTTPWKVTIDMVAPVAPTVTVNESGGDVIPNGGLTNSYGISVNWNAVADAANYEYRYSNSIPGNPYNVPNYYLVTGITGTSLSGEFNQGDGLHHIEVRAIDAAGNPSPWSTVYNINYDGTAPATPTLVSPADGVPVNGTNPIANNWNDVADAHHYIYESYNVDGAGICNLSSVRFTSDYSDSQTNSRTFADGLKFCWRVKAVDAAGNESGWSSLWKTIADNVAPTVVITNPTNGAIHSGAVELRATVEDANPHHYWLQIKRNGSVVNIPGVTGTKNTTVSFTDQLLTTLTTEGTYEVTLAARDAVGGGSSTGNRSADVVINFVIDNTAPAVPAHLSPADNTFTTTANQTSIDWDDVSDTNGPVSYQYQSANSTATNPDGSFVSPAYTSGTLTTSEIPTPGTPEGVYYWHVRAQDGAGNWSAWSTPWKITVDNTVPALVSQTTFSGWYTSNQTSTFEYADANGVVSGTPVTCDITTEGTGQTCSVTPNVCDAAGNCNTTAVTSNGADIDVSLPAVSFSINPPTPDGDNDWYVSEPGVTLTATDAISGVDYTEYRLNGGAWITYSSPFALSDGIWAVEYRAFDVAGNESATGSVSNIQVDTQDPDEVNDLDAEYRDDEEDIQLTWNVDDDDIDQVFIYRGSSSSFNTNSGNEIGENDDNDDTFSDDDVEVGETYYYKLVSIDEAGNRSGANTIRVEIDEDGDGGGTAIVTNLGTQPADGGEVLGVETSETGEGQATDEGSAATDEGAVLGAATENSEVNGLMDFLKKYSWWWLIILVILGYLGYKYYAKKTDPLV